MVSALLKKADCLMDHRRISVGKRNLCLDLLSCSYSHPEQHLQNAVCSKLFPCKTQRVFYLGKDLVLSQNLRFQSACEIKKMLYSLLIFSADKVFSVFFPFNSLQPAKPLIEFRFFIFFRAYPEFQPVAG